MLESWSHRIDLLVLKCKNYIDNIKLQVHVVMNTRICCSRVLVNAVGIFISLVDSRVSGEGLKEVLLKTKVSRMVWYQTLVSGPITQLKYYSGQVTPQSCITIKQVHYFHLLNTHTAAIKPHKSSPGIEKINSCMDFSKMRTVVWVVLPTP